VSKVRKVCVVITARPSYARIKTVLSAIEAQEGLELQLIVAASALLDRYGKVVEVIRADGFAPDATVYALVEGENLVTSAKSTGMAIMELATLFDTLKPDIVVSVADRYETIATAIAAAYLNRPVCHVQGGEVTGSIDEKVRHAVTKLSDIHCVASDDAARRVIAMGEAPETVHVTGCPSIDLAATIGSEEAADFDVYAAEGGQGVGHAFDPGAGYMVVMQHPVTTNHEAAAAQLRTTLEVVDASGHPTFWFWPNVDAGSDASSKMMRVYREQNDPQSIYFLKNLSPENFLRLLRGARCIVGNSSVGIRESAYLGLPTVNIGERQRRRLRGPNVVDVDYDSGTLAEAIAKQWQAGRYPGSDIYGDGQAGPRIAQLLAETALRIDKVISY
jgi:UDP-hydrolysing UDP-N-acetyl-D-glucosamine 2-epimerase